MALRRTGRCQAGGSGVHWMPARAAPRRCRGNCESDPADQPLGGTGPRPRPTGDPAPRRRHGDRRRAPAAGAHRTTHAMAARAGSARRRRGRTPGPPGVRAVARLERGTGPHQPAQAAARPPPGAPAPLRGHRRRPAHGAVGRRQIHVAGRPRVHRRRERWGSGDRGALLRRRSAPGLRGRLGRRRAGAAASYRRRGPRRARGECGFRGPRRRCRRARAATARDRRAARTGLPATDEHAGPAWRAERGAARLRPARFGAGPRPRSHPRGGDDSDRRTTSGAESTHPRRASAGRTRGRVASGPRRVAGGRRWPCPAAARDRRCGHRQVPARRGAGPPSGLGDR
jgi:hypothetical protein